MTWPTPGGNNVSDNYDSLLGGRATPSASFKGQFPVLWEGVVEEATKKPAFEYDPSKPNNRGAQKFWADGNPVENVWITLQTNVRNDQEDDGRRVLVLDSKNKLEAVQAAVRESGASFAKGGRLSIEWYGNDPNGKNPDNPPKLYRARYQGPTLDATLGQQAPPTPPAYGQQGTAPAWGQQQPAPAPAAPGTGGWGSPPPAAPASTGASWGTAAAPAAAPGPAPTATGNGWGAPAAPPVQPDPQTYDEFVAAFKRKGVDPSTITSPEQAAQVWAYVKNNPDVA